jgi:hypothetical protein
MPHSARPCGCLPLAARYAGFGTARWGCPAAAVAAAGASANRSKTLDAATARLVDRCGTDNLLKTSTDTTGCGNLIYRGHACVDDCQWPGLR